MFKVKRYSLACAGLAIVARLGMPRELAADEVSDWNVTGFEAATAGGQNAVVMLGSGPSDLAPLAPCSTIWSGFIELPAHCRPSTAHGGRRTREAAAAE